MDAGTFLQLAEKLTGTLVKDVTQADRDCLNKILADDTRSVACSQFNELLLLINKDRVTDCFFGYFFGENSSVGDLPAGVEKFQKTAMLCFGNFIYAFRTLSRCVDREDLARQLGETARTADQIFPTYTQRTQSLLDIELIAKSDTPLVGYLSGREIVADLGRAKVLKEKLPEDKNLPGTTWQEYSSAVIDGLGANEHAAIQTVLDSFGASHTGATVGGFAAYVKEIIPRLEQQDARVKAVRAKATQNQDIYLTWDYMDVYFATSMRKKWEFEDLFDFVQKLTAHDELLLLKLRHFDPTQAFTEDRVNKGLVEALMLKRARCTVYSVQDTDTLGKDSELAATLAQGKPVIAYVPAINVESRLQTLKEEDPGTIQDRLRFVIYADDLFFTSLSVDNQQFVRDFKALDEFETKRIWRSIPDPEAIEKLKKKHGAELERLCRIIASSEANIYDRRAKTLKESHPLGIQVNLDTGVANGVLVVRTVDDCAKLLRRIIMNTMEFDLEETSGFWYLRERISGCVYRVVSKNRKLTNCFWNFYRRPSSGS
jgi:hypothetical protein